MKMRILAFMVLVQVGTAGAGEHSSTAGDTGQTNLQQEFVRRCSSLDPKRKETMQERTRVVASLLEELSEKARQREFDRIVAAPPTKVPTEFDRLLLEQFAWRFIRSNQWNSLERLLVVRCPEYILGRPLEFALAEREPGAVSVLFKAYTATGTNASSQVLVRCLARAFPALRKASNSNKDFVKTCSTWLEDNKARCILNTHYPYLVNAPLTDFIRAESGEEDEKFSLFLLK